MKIGIFAAVRLWVVVPTFAVLLVDRPGGPPHSKGARRFQSVLNSCVVKDRVKLVSLLHLLQR